LPPNEEKHELIWIREGKSFTPINVSGIESKYRALGGSEGFLGRPRDHEKTCHDKKGRYRHYDNGYIFWHPAHGAYEVHGGILNEWEHNDWERGLLGYPVSDELDWNTDDLRKMLPANYTNWTNADVSIGKWLDDKILHGNINKLGRCTKFQRGFITWWDNILAPDQEKHEWIWIKDGDFYIPHFESKKKKTESHSHPTNIGEKVRFWEEQDKINQLLIPRVVELHEKVVKLSKHAATAAESLAGCESRIMTHVTALHNEILPLQSGLNSVLEDIVSIKGLVVTAGSQIDALNKDQSTANDKISFLEENLSNSRNQLAALQEECNTLKLSRADFENTLQIIQEQVSEARDVSMKYQEEVIHLRKALRQNSVYLYVAMGLGIIAIILACVRLL